MTGAKFERELREVEREIIQHYSRRLAADRRTSTVHVLVDLRNSYGRRRGDQRTALPQGLLNNDLGG
jgi:hypothetical protein